MRTLDHNIFRSLFFIVFALFLLLGHIWSVPHVWGDTSGTDSQETQAETPEERDEAHDESEDFESGIFEETDDEFEDEENVFGDEEDVFGDEDESEEDIFASDDGENEMTSMEAFPLEIQGFVEVERGARLGESTYRDETWMLSNIRARLKTSKQTEKGGFHLKLDFINDEILKSSEVEIREARLRYSPSDLVDFSIGKQVSTWGVGDLLFINDLFPKNWVNLFLGRDQESLKDTSNSIRITTYLENWTADLIWTPEFSPDTTPNGCRFTVFDPNLGKPTAQRNQCGKTTKLPEQNDTTENGEIALRLKTRMGSQEVALYGYNGFWKSPKGLKLNPDTQTLESFYPRRGAYGFSSEGQWGPGVFFFEAGHYLSYEDLDGTNPLIENSAARLLLGYRYTFLASSTFAVQTMSEKMLNYEKYQESVPPTLEEKEEVRNTYTFRFTQTAQQETLKASCFVYHRPEDRDDYLRCWLSKRLDDNFDITAGGNFFSGDKKYLDRDFAMLREDDNAYVRFKYVF